VNGFAQINAVIPADLHYGGNLPLVVQIGGVASQIGVTLAVSGPPAPIPGAPQTLSSSSNASGQIVLTWAAADGLAARFHVERQNGGTGAFTEIAVVPVPATTFTDTGVTPGISYQYRLRAENDFGFSAYSALTTATVPIAALTPPSNIQAVPASQTQINLTWNTASTNATKFHIERKSGATGSYAEIIAVPGTATSYQDTTVQPSTTYTFRMRSEGATGALSSYSSETSATTPALPLPPAPTLQATATSSSQVHLSWSTTATGILIFSMERRTTTGGYLQISQPSAASTSIDDSGLTGSTTYLYRMRVQTSAGFSGYSNEAMVTTLQLVIPQTVFLIHGLNQTHLDMKNLAVNLASSYGLAAGRFTVDYGFEFGDCADRTLAFCSANCTIPGGAQRLAQHIAGANPPGDIVLIGFSLGGLIARDMIVNNRLILNGRKINLVTIGTPNLGYPYLASDSLVFCSAIVSAMEGNWRSQPGSIVLSSYLLSLTNQWSAYGFPGSGRTWLAASGRACNIPTRLTTGCRDQNKYSDGVVCQDSAAYNVSTSAGTQPNQSWADPNGAYYHSSSGFTALILCDTSGLNPTRYFPLYDPPPTPGGLFSYLTAVLNGM
jgi:pimeloyl-ACP methyl ester carboxylesterase